MTGIDKVKNTLTFKVLNSNPNEKLGESQEINNLLDNLSSQLKLKEEIESGETSLQVKRASEIDPMIEVKTTSSNNPFRHSPDIP